MREAIITKLRATKAITTSKLQTLLKARTKIPIFGHYFKCTWKDFWESFVEYSNSLLWSTMPFWLGALVLFYQQQNGERTFIDTLTSTFRNGELLVFTIGAVTPITYLSLFEHPKAAFPHRLSLGTVAMCLIVICASLFALQKGQVATKSSLTYHTSLIFAVIAITLRYTSIVYNRSKIPFQITETDLSKPTQDYFDKFKEATDETVSDHTPPNVASTTEQQDEFSRLFNQATPQNPTTGR